jgi:dTDP-glucose pyrophosphorylase
MKSILIMAAGNGSRYGTLKQFDQLGPNEEFLFEYTLYDAISAGFDHVVIVTKKEHVNNLREYLSSRLPEKVTLDVISQEISDLPEGVRYSFERNKPWGTAHAVWTARNVINGSFVVANADDYYGSDCMRLAMDFICSGPDALEFASVPYKLSETLSPEGSVSRAICIADEDYLESIDEVAEILRVGDEIYDKETSKQFSGEEVTSMNFWVFGPAIFDLIEKDLVEFINSGQTDEKAEIYIPKQIQSWIEKGKARVRLTGSGSDWFGVTYAQDKIRAVKSLKEQTESKLYPSPLWNR